MSTLFLMWGVITLDIYLKEPYLNKILFKQYKNIISESSSNSKTK